MKNAELFSDVMSLLWGFGEAGVPLYNDKFAQAVASYAKTHRVNTENAFEVLNIMWPTKFTMTARTPGEGTGDIEPGVFWFDLTFEDGSQCMVRSHYGIGDSVE